MVPEPAFDHIFWLWTAVVVLAVYNVVVVHHTVRTMGAFMRWAKVVTDHLQGRDPLKPPPPGVL
jgi:hypothetical protein